MLRDPAKAFLVSDEAFDKKMDELGWSLGDMDTMINMYGQKTVYDIGEKIVRQWFRELLELFFQAASLLIDTLRTFFLIVLSILGPISFALAVYDGFQSTLTTWLSRYICIYLWLPVGDLFGAILSRIQILMLQQDIKQMQDPTFIPDASNSVLYFHDYRYHRLFLRSPPCPRGLSRQAVRELTGRRPTVQGRWPETVRRQSVGQSADR